LDGLACRRKTGCVDFNGVHYFEEFDLVILGGGTGSTIAAWTIASAIG
jgi:hypothetical protein